MTAEKKSTTKKETDLLKAHKALAEKKKAAAHAPEKKVEAKKPVEHKTEAKAEAKAEVKKPEAQVHKKPVEPKPETAKHETVKPEVTVEKDAAASAVAPKTEKKKPEPAIAKKVKKVRKEKVIEKIEFLATEVKEVVGRKKKPSFIRQEYYKLPRLKLVWRKPRGIDSKQHEGKKPDVGYGTPESIRGMHGAGYFPIVVNNVKEVSKIDTKTQAAVIAAAVGRNKRNEIIKVANKLKIIILNPKKGETK
jgi:large subunit ribosomal protein L32e